MSVRVSKKRRIVATTIPGSLPSWGYGVGAPVRGESLRVSGNGSIGGVLDVGGLTDAGILTVSGTASLPGTVTIGTLQCDTISSAAPSSSMAIGADANTTTLELGSLSTAPTSVQILSASTVNLLTGPAGGQINIGNNSNTSTVNIGSQATALTTVNINPGHSAAPVNIGTSTTSGGYTGTIAIGNTAGPSSTSIAGTVTVGDDSGTDTTTIAGTTISIGTGSFSARTINIGPQANASTCNVNINTGNGVGTVAIGGFNGNVQITGPTDICTVNDVGHLNLGTAGARPISIGNSSSTTAMAGTITFPTATASGTWSGPGGTSASQTITFTRIGQMVHARLPAVTAVASFTSSSLLSWSGTIPAGFVPVASTAVYGAMGVNGSLNVETGFIVTHAGAITCFLATNSGPFTGQTWSPTSPNDALLIWPAV